MTRRYPATASAEELARYIKLEGEVVSEERCVEVALAAAGPALKPRKAVLRWAWALGIPFAAALFVFPEQLPLDMISFFAVICCLAALWVRGVQYEPFTHAVEPRRSVTWRGSASTEVFGEPKSLLAPSDDTFRVSSSAKSAAPGQLLALNSLDGLPASIREQIAKLREDAKNRVDENVPDSFAHFGNIGVSIGLCALTAFANTKSNDWRVIAVVVRVLLGLSFGWSLASVLASGRAQLKERWRRRVLEEQLIFAACAGVPDTVLPVLAANENFVDLEFVPRSR